MNVTKLPIVFQTTAQKEFFSATVDQLFAKKSTEQFDGFVGQRSGAYFRPLRDSYVGEATKDQAVYQLEPAGVFEDTSVFYPQLVDYLGTQGALIGNHDRLFSTVYYSYAPPIDLDKFVNYGSYEWVPNGLPEIEIAGFDDNSIETQIIGQPQFEINNWLPDFDLKFTSGLVVSFPNSTQYQGRFHVEGVGREIDLVPVMVHFEPGAKTIDPVGQDYAVNDRIVLVNDTVIQVTAVDAQGAVTGFRVLQHQSSNFELNGSPVPSNSLVTQASTDSQNGTGFEVVAQGSMVYELNTKEYVAIERNRRDNTVWNTTNRWYHRGTIQTSNQARQALQQIQSPGTVFEPTRGVTARRPIIEFVRYLELFPSARAQFKVPQTQNSVSPQWPRFQLYDSEGVRLDANQLGQKYQGSGFRGSTIFRYARSNRAADSELGFPTQKRNLGQLGDLVFENSIFDSVVFDSPDGPAQVPGYRFYRVFLDAASSQSRFETVWHPSEQPWLQPVIDRFLAEPNQSSFELTAPPTTENGVFNIQVHVDGIRKDTSQFSYNPATQSVELQAPVDSVVEISTHTVSNVSQVQDGYFEPPISLRANPDYQDVLDATWNDLSRHFISTIQNQPGFLGAGFGGTNNHRDSAKQLWRGQQIVQSVGNLSKVMLSASNQKLNITKAIEFSALEYARYKNKLIGTLKQMINENFQPLAAGDQVTAAWLDQAIQRLVKSREFSNGFDDTYMLPWSNLYEEEKRPTLGTQVYELNKFVDLKNRQNSMLVYLGDSLLVQGKHYDIIDFNPITVQFRNPLPVPAQLVFRLFKDATPAYVPATPSQLGLTAPTWPTIETDSTTLTPISVIVGHDNSRVPVFGNVIDNVLLEFERRIFTNLSQKFVSDYEPLLITEHVRPGFDRETRWSKQEWQTLLRSQFVRWATYQKVDWRTNETFSAADPWSWNYQGLVIEYQGREYTLSGSWQAVFMDLYDTVTPHLTPWQMLGFKNQPTWWTAEYGTDFGSNNTAMWTDIENGQIRHGARQGIDQRFARPGLVATRLPVTAQGTLFSTPLESIGWVGPLPADFDPSRNWSFGQMGTVEQIWTRSEWYDYHVSLALFLAVPALWSELCWDPVQQTTLGVDPRQVVNTSTQKRQGNQNIVVHGEATSQGTQINSGYQVWITSRIKSINGNVSTVFGNALRSFSLKLGYLMSGFSKNVEVYASSPGTAGQSTTLVVLSQDLSLELQTSPPLENYVYSGVLVRAVGDGSYQVFGYDTVTEQFVYIPRAPSANDQKITVGGQSKPWVLWEPNREFLRGTIVKLNGTFYESKQDQATGTFVASQWQRLDELPVQGGVSVFVRKTAQDQTLSLDYGHVFANVQEVVDFLLGYQDWLVSQGFVFDELDTETGQTNTWLEVAKSFLFWTTANWDTNEAIALSPAANQLKLETRRGILSSLNSGSAVVDQNGVNIEPKSRRVKRSGQQVLVQSLLENVGVYGMRATSQETQSALLIENRTRFGDLIFDPVLGLRQPRLRIRGERTTPWQGLLQAPGYVVVNNQLVPSFETLVDDIRNYYSTESVTTLPQTQEVAKHLTNFVVKQSLTDVGLDENAQFLFYQSTLPIKGTARSLQQFKLEQQDSTMAVDESWAFKVGKFGSLCSQQTVEMVMPAREFRSDSQLVEFDFLSNTDTNRFTPGSIVVDFNNPEQWLTKPTPASCARPEQLWPTWQKTTNIPNAGYVHLDDVDYSIFSSDQLFDLWLKPKPPTQNSLIHVARAPDWDVFGFINTFDQVTAQSIRGTAAFVPNFGERINATASIDVDSNGQVSSISLVSGGNSGQTAQSNLEITLGQGRGAVVSTTVDANDVVDSVSLVESGEGYGVPTEFDFDLDPPTSLPTAMGAEIRAQINNQGQVGSVVFNTQGERYSSGIRTIAVPGSSGTESRITVPSVMGRLNDQQAAFTSGSGYAQAFTKTLDPQNNLPQPPGVSQPTITLSLGAVVPAVIRAVVVPYVLTALSFEELYSVITNLVIEDGGFGYVADNGTGNGVRTINSLVLDNGVEINTNKGNANIRLVIENFRIVNFLLPQYDSFDFVGIGSLIDPQLAFGTVVPTTRTGVLIDPNVFQPPPTPSAASFNVDLLDFVPDQLNSQPVAASTATIVDSGFGFQNGTYPGQTDQFGGEWTVVVSNNQVTSVTNTVVGAWPPDSTVELSVMTGINVVAGVPAEISVNVDAFGRITSATLISGGSGYKASSSFEPTFNGGTGANIEFAVEAGAISSITLTNGGSGYANPRTITFQDSTPPDTRIPARLRAKVNRFGKLQSITVINGGIGNYFAANVDTDTQPVPPNNSNGVNGEIEYRVNQNGSISSASLLELINAGSGYLEPTTRNVELVSNALLSRNFEFDINGTPVVFLSQDINDVAGIADTINQAQIPGITARLADGFDIVMSGPQLVIRSLFDSNITVQAQTPTDQSLWQEQVGIEWFGTTAVEAVLRQAADLSIGVSADQLETLSFQAGSTAETIAQTINNQQLPGIQASVEDGLLTISSNFNPNIQVLGDLVWQQDFDVKIEGTQPVLFLGQLSRAIETPGIEFEPGVVAFNNPLPSDARVLFGFVLINDQLYGARFVGSSRITEEQTVWLYQLLDGQEQPIPANTFFDFDVSNPQSKLAFVPTSLRFDNQSNVEVELSSIEGLLILNQTQNNFNGAANNGTFISGIGYSVGDTIDLENGAQVTVDSIGSDQNLIAAQDQNSFDGVGNNGTFVPGSNYAQNDNIILNNGAVVSVEAVDGAGAITQFEITATIGQPQPGTTYTQAAGSATSGTGFEIAAGTNNQTPVGDVAEFTITDITGQSPVIGANTITSTGGSGQGFALVPNRNNLQTSEATRDIVLNQEYLTRIQAFDHSRPVVYWADQSFDHGWVVREFDSDQDVFVTRRAQQDLVDTPNVINAFVYDQETADTLLQLPVYDPFKGLIAGAAAQNITYFSVTDPARYNSPTAQSFRKSNNPPLGDANIGEVWWDLSKAAYYWYEQGTNSYRRNNWGKLVPGSSIDIYEWTRCNQPPSEYTGAGQVKDVDNYVVKQEFDTVTFESKTVYYFWVKNKPQPPTDECVSTARSLSTTAVARLISDPRRQQLRWFSPISQDALVLAGIDRTFTDSNNVLQVNYRTNTKNPLHKEWELGQEDSARYLPNPEIWQKMISSLSEWAGPFDQGSYLDQAGFSGNQPDPTDPSLVWLPVPAPNLSSTQRYGIQTRPRQTVFVHSNQARGILAQTLNQVLAPFRLRDELPNWDAGFDTGTLWQWQDWWAPGRSVDNTVPTRRVSQVSQLELAENLFDGEVILVAGARNSLYQYNLSEDRFEIVYKQSARVEIDQAQLESETWSLTQARQLTQLMAALSERIFQGTRRALENQVFFALLNYVFGEQPNIDWAFKTTLLDIKQPTRRLEQTPVLEPSQIGLVRQHVEEYKPYHSKIRTLTDSVATPRDSLEATAQELQFDQAISMRFDRIRCGLSLPELRAIRSAEKFDGSRELFDHRQFISDGVQQTFFLPPTFTQPVITIDGAEQTPGSDYVIQLPTIANPNATVTLNLFQAPTVGQEIVATQPISIATGAAGRYAASLTQLLQDILFVPGTQWSDYTQAQPNAQDELKEIKAAAKINQAIRTKLRCDFRGITYDANGLKNTIPWDYTQWDETPWDGSLDILASQFDAANTELANSFQEQSVSETVADGASSTFPIPSGVLPDLVEARVDGVVVFRNMDYFVIGGQIWFVDPPAANSVIELYTVMDAGSLLNPQVQANITDEMIPLRITEALVLTVTEL